MDLNNLRDLVQALLAAHGLALLVVNLTPTPRDDVILARLYRALEMVAGLWSPMAKR
jgi:hypothetical protein